MATPDRKILIIPELKEEKRQFEAAIVGQEEAVETCSVLAARIKSGVRAGKGPIDVKFLAGPSGVGKTEIVKQLAEVLSGDPSARNKLIRIDAQEYSHGHEVAKLTGPPPGYLGSGDPARGREGVPVLFSQKNIDSHTIKYKDRNGQEKSVVIILVDEAEKGAPELHKLFLGVMDEGRMQLGDNSMVDLTNAVIFFTSNVGNDDVERARKGLSEEEADTPAFKEKARILTMDALSGAFPPEFRGRIQEMILFKSLKPEQLERIAGLMLHQVEEDMWESVSVDLELQASPQAMSWLRNQGYNPSEGARALGKVIKRFIADPIALLHTDVDLNRKTIYIDIDPESDEVQFFDVPINEERIFRTKKEVSPQTAKSTNLSESNALRNGQDKEPKVTVDVNPRLENINVHIATRVNTPSESSDTRLREQQLAEIDSAIIDPLVTALRKGPELFSEELEKVVIAGLVTVEQVGADRKIRALARDRILSLRRQSIFSRIFRGNEAEREIQSLVKVGIGTIEDWRDTVDFAKKWDDTPLERFRESLSDFFESLRR